jgi:cold shock CspA family protein
MEAGTIKNWNREKGFGFLKMRDPTIPDAFLHIREIRNLTGDDIPAVGDVVLFDLAPPVEGRPSPRAINALLIMGAEEI